jgi:hypothetical protein
MLTPAASNDDSPTGNDLGHAGALASFTHTAQGREAEKKPYIGKDLHGRVSDISLLSRGGLQLFRSRDRRVDSQTFYGPKIAP